MFKIKPAAKIIKLSRRENKNYHFKILFHLCTAWEIINNIFCSGLFHCLLAITQQLFSLFGLQAK